MARKRTEIALQVEIETQEEWEEMLAKEGLTVVDIYQEWCGPCKGMTSNFRRLKNELGDDLLRFAVAKADSVDSLEKYRGRCEPCFLFFAGGILVSVIRGANSPLLMRAITEQLSYEHRVLDGGVERKEIKDPQLADLDDQDRSAENYDDEDDEGVRHGGERVIYDSLPETADGYEAAVQKGVTVAIIKPNVVQEGKVDEILNQMREAGIEILESTERQLTEEEAREFYAHCSEQDYFEDLVKFMASGPSQVLVLTKGDTGEGIIEEWRELLGPTSVEEAKEKAPESLRAKYGKESYVNAVHGSDTKERAMAELAFFFPGFVAPTYTTRSQKKPKVQRTLALIRPDALKDRKDEILSKIQEAGFQVAMQKEMQLTKDQAEEFYSEHKNQPYFDELTNRMSNGPLLALALAREDAVNGWRDLLGPKEVDQAKSEAPDSLRAQFSVEDVPINQLHGSDSTSMAEEEIKYFFPMQQTVAAIKPDAYQTKDDIMKRIKEAGFHIAARKETELTQDIASQFYGDNKDKDYFSDLTEHMTSGPTLFMVLSREDAVEGWRSLIGPTDPQQAKDQAPDSLRAEFGSDIKANAVHGSSNPDHAKNSMQLIFGDLEFNADGTVLTETVHEESFVKGEDDSKPSDDQPTGDDSKSQHDEDKSQHGDDKSEHRDNASQHGDNVSQRGDNVSQHGDNVSQRGDNVSQRGDNVSQRGDNASQRGDDNADKAEDDGRVSEQQQEVDTTRPESTTDKGEHVSKVEDTKDVQGRESPEGDKDDDDRKSHGKGRSSPKGDKDDDDRKSHGNGRSSPKGDKDDDDRRSHGKGKSSPRGDKDDDGDNESRGKGRHSPAGDKDGDAGPSRDDGRTSPEGIKKDDGPSRPTSAKSGRPAGDDVKQEKDGAAKSDTDDKEKRLSDKDKAGDKGGEQSEEQERNPTPEGDKKKDDADA